MYTIYLSDILTTELDLSCKNPCVKLTARVHIDYQRGNVEFRVLVFDNGIFVHCDDEQLARKVYVSRDVLLAARLFGNLL